MWGKTLWLSCDGTQAAVCSEEIVEHADRATRPIVMAEALKAGWLVRSDIQLCPIHRGQSAPS